MTDDRLDQRLREAADAYHRPPDLVPREEMWAKIVTARAATPIRVRRPPPWWSLAAAAVLLVGAGIAIGRRTTSPTPEAGIARADSSADTTGRTPYELATVQHLTRAEALLTAFNSGVGQRHTDVQLASWARDLLANTRLLLHSRAADDPARRALLEDLELVLVQIVQLSPDLPAPERELVEGTISGDEMLTRLRTAIPAGQRGT